MAPSIVNSVHYNLVLLCLRYPVMHLLVLKLIVAKYKIDYVCIL